MGQQQPQQQMQMMGGMQGQPQQPQGVYQQIPQPMNQQ